MRSWTASSSDIMCLMYAKLEQSVVGAELKELVVDGL